MSEGLRKGYTTGSCAAAAAKAASYMLLTGKTLSKTSILTPAGITYYADIEDICRNGGSVSCAVRKDSGDDPDITNGILIYAEVSIAEDTEVKVEIMGGKGIGTVTKPGLDRPVGSPAINSTPLTMITADRYHSRSITLVLPYSSMSIASMVRPIR